MYTDHRIAIAAYDEHVREAEQRIARIRALDERRASRRDHTAEPIAQPPRATTAVARIAVALRRRLRRFAARLTA
ncbi:hypothetical protein [Microbacterium sp. G2-8]|uniref:hypothetical protein n=1 Tax=Microbacterium sp. G2-8 TaxID=2842454 RepID=UPI001C89A349|nr:hypothetical protein [Microbacterium sp. G2-8]